MDKTISQADRMDNLFLDGCEHSTIEINRVVYGSEQTRQARIASRVNDLVNRGREFLDFNGNVIPKFVEGKKCVHRGYERNGMYFYQMKITPKVVLEEKQKWSPSHFINLERAKQFSLF